MKTVRISESQSNSRTVSFFCKRSIELATEAIDLICTFQNEIILFLHVEKSGRSLRDHQVFDPFLISNYSD